MKTAQPHIAPQNLAPLPQWPLLALIGSLTILALLYASLAVLGLLDQRPQTGGAPAPARVIVGDVALTVPQDFIRFDHQRGDGAISRLDMAVPWPMNPISNAELEVDAGGTTIFVSITPKDEALPPVQRVSSVYKRFLSPQIEAAPGGLAKRRFTPNSGYDGETLYYDPARPGGYFVRCAASAGDAPASCLREIRVRDQIDIVYRFPQTMLPEWELLEANMMALTSAIGVPEER